MVDHQTTPLDTVDNCDHVGNDWRRYRATTQLTNHWDRPGWTPGRRSYHWLLSLASFDELDALVGQCQQALADIPALDLVPPGSLHVTLQRVGFTDQLTTTDAATVAAAARARCAGLAPLRLTIGPLAGSAGAVRLSVGPHPQVCDVRAAVIAAIADARGAAAVPGRRTPFIPHASIAYCNRETDAKPIIERVAALRRLPPVPVTIDAADLVELRRERCCYTWLTIATVRLSAAP